MLGNQGRGGGIFAAGPRIFVGPAGAAAVVIADLDGDGRQDVVTSHVTVLLNRGGGLFDPRSYPAGMEPRAIVAGDFDGDARPDLVVAGDPNGRLMLLHNSGGGTFAAPIAYAGIPGATALTQGDLDGDGRPDLVVTSPGKYAVATLLNRCW